MKYLVKKMWLLYVLIFGSMVIGGCYLIRNYHRKSILKITNTSIELLTDSVSLGHFGYHSIKKGSFEIRNIGNNSLTIRGVNVDCDCTEAKYDKRPIPQGETTTVVLEYKPNSLGYFRKTADVVCNVPEGYIRLTISGEIAE